MISSVPTTEEQVLAAAQRRAEALVAGDPDALRALLHPSLRWTTFRGAVLTRDEYVEANTGSGLGWRSQRLRDPQVVVVGDTAVLTAVVLDEVQRGPEVATFTLRLTQTWVRGARGWQCLAGHAGPEVA
jgi:hypothetical protein